jgi:hypothetical protein
MEGKHGGAVYDKRTELTEESVIMASQWTKKKYHFANNLTDQIYPCKD